MTVEGLMALDMAFCEAVSKKGAQGWANHFLDEGIMVTKTGDNIITEPKIYAYMKPFFEGKGASLVWSPEGGGLSTDTTLGYTYGKYIRTSMGESGEKIQEIGRYTTIWRQVAHHAYRVELDMGN